jgi:hypothetical protein
MMFGILTVSMNPMDLFKKKDNDMEVDNYETT